MNRAAAWALDLLFPPKCVFCGALLKAGEEGFCAACQTALPWLVGEAAEQAGELFSLCVSPLRYQDTVRDSLRRYKFQGQRGYAGIYGRLLAQCVQDHLAGRYDLITWAPLSAARKRERGYDQAFLLAQTTAAQLGGRAEAVLRKSRHTRAQSGLDDDSARRINVRDAYQVIAPELARGRRILLIDDIVTTGSTLSACAKALRDAGAEEIFCATVARAR